MKKIILILIVLPSWALAFSLFSQNQKQVRNDESLTPPPVTSSGGVLADLTATSGSCGNIPSQVQAAFKESVAFSNSGCGPAKLAPGKYIAVNDYSRQNGYAPAMYIFDQNGKCVKSVPVSWGVPASGRSPSNYDMSKKIPACSTDGSNLTPPGFHLTTKHDGGKYDSSNSVGLAGLCGQPSSDRGVVIHAAHGVAGRYRTQGCPAVPEGDLRQIMNFLGEGSLVYNYFGPNPLKDCSSDAGFKPTCNPEPEAYVAAKNAGVNAVRPFGYGTGSGGGRGNSNSNNSGK